MNEPKLIPSVTSKDEAMTACHEMEGMLGAIRMFLGQGDTQGAHDLACLTSRQAELVRNWAREEIVGTQAAPPAAKKVAQKKASTKGGK